MLRFAVYRDGKPAQSIDLSGAYLLGGDGVPVRADIEFKNGEITCTKRGGGPAALAVLWPVASGGRMMLETTRLSERDAPYVLQLELLRGRLMRLAQKREDWGLHDFEGTDEISKNIDVARDHLIDGLKADTPAMAAAIAEKGIAIGLSACEQLTAFHAEIFLNRRKQVGGFPRRLFGCTVNLGSTDKTYRKRLHEAVDYIAIPFTWNELEPREREIRWGPFDEWVDWAIKNRVSIRGSNLVSLAESSVPAWARVWEHDYEAIRDLLYEHLRRVITRYGQHVQVWDVISGVHARNSFSFNFEQLMELTRMSATVAKQLAPRSISVIDLITPWGEYYAASQRTIPPLLYAEMIIQSGVTFDAFGVQCYFGLDVEGMFVRDIFQISSMLDRFACLGKPVHLTGLQAPSDVTTDKFDAWEGRQSVQAGGAWHKEWSEETQRAWLRRVYHIALSKPFVEAITWRDLSDNARHYLPNGGLLGRDLAPKMAYNELLALRRELAPENKRAAPAVNM